MSTCYICRKAAADMHEHPCYECEQPVHHDVAVQHPACKRFFHFNCLQVHYLMPSRPCRVA